MLHLEERPEGVLPQQAFHEPQPVSTDEVTAGQLVPGCMDKGSLTIEIEVSHLALGLKLRLFALIDLRHEFLALGRNGHTGTIDHLDAPVGQDGCHQLLYAVVADRIVTVNI